jgi:hypothetical protein
VAEESFFSGPNVSWFLVGIFAEVAFLGIGVSPMGMEWGANIAEGLGLIEPFSAAAGEGIAVLPQASTGVDVLEF